MYHSKTGVMMRGSVNAPSLLYNLLLAVVLVALSVFILKTIDKELTADTVRVCADWPKAKKAAKLAKAGPNVTLREEECVEGKLP